MEEGLEELMKLLNDGWYVVNVHNNTDPQLTIYLLGRKS